MKYSGNNTQSRLPGIDSYLSTANLEDTQNGGRVNSLEADYEDGPPIFSGSTMRHYKNVNEVGLDKPDEGGSRLITFDQNSTLEKNIIGSSLQ